MSRVAHLGWMVSLCWVSLAPSGCSAAPPARATPVASAPPPAQRAKRARVLLDGADTVGAKRLPISSSYALDWSELPVLPAMKASATLTPPRGFGLGHAPQADAKLCNPAEIWQEGISGPSASGEVAFIQVEYAVNARCQAQSMATATSKAAMVVEHAAYALRVCNSGCDQPPESASRSEQLVIVTPPATWHAASVAPEEQRSGDFPAFSRIKLPVRRGTSSSALVTLPATSLLAFMAKSGVKQTTSQALTVMHEGGLQVSFEITWPADDEAPLAMVFVTRAARAQ